ncbi:hypothetical protein [Methylosinus sp. PW1]|uniref:hypothetical protein n=1 Tax=Methylosinus sp. PW1 TaxID=107636 RepID=UPI00056013BF|nr:hypothetical protein [Methylosinus sp. PW1]
MANIGLGIGSFINGLTSGVNAARQWDQADQLQKIRERQLSIMENQDRRAEDKAKLDAENNAQDRKWKQEDRDSVEEEKTKNEPIKDAQRKSILTGLNDASAERDAKSAAGSAAQKEMDANPGKYGSFEDAYRAVAVPKIQQHYLSRGETDKADAFGKWSNDKRTEAGIKSFGNFSNSIAVGDWGGATKHLQSIFDDPAYMAPHGYKIGVEPIRDDSGKQIGVRGTTTGPDGQTQTKDFTDPGQLYQFVSPIINPHSAFEWAKTVHDNEIAAKSQRASERNKLSDQIELEGFKQQGQADLKSMEIAGKIAEKRADGIGMDPKEYTKAVLDMSKNMADNGMLSKPDANGKSVPMSAEEAIAAAADRVDQAVIRQKTQGATPGARPIMPGAQTTPQVAPSRQVPLFARAQPPAPAAPDAQPAAAQPPAQAPAAPQQAQQPQGLTVEQQYAQKYGAPLYYNPDEVDMWRRQRGI